MAGRAARAAALTLPAGAVLGRARLLGMGERRPVVTRLHVGRGARYVPGPPQRAFRPVGVRQSMVLHHAG